MSQLEASEKRSGAEAVEVERNPARNLPRGRLSRRRPSRSRGNRAAGGAAFVDPIEVGLAELGNHAGVVGAAALALEARR